MTLSAFRGGRQELPTTASTPHGIYKRKYHLRALFQSIAFIALLGGYHFYNKLGARGLEKSQFSRQPPEQQDNLFLGKVADHRRLSMVVGDDVGAAARAVEWEQELGISNGFFDSDSNNYHHDSRHLSQSVNGSVSCADLEIADPGWFTVFYSIGVLYMFLAIAIVCDEYFVEALEEISSDRHMNIDSDVAGATLMAAGGSAPELFTNLFGTFDESQIGFGTILGSAAFNVLLVIAACSFAAKETLDLSWWPLFRDTSYYAVNLIVLAIFVGVSSPDEIEAWEAVVLFLMYIGYVLIMWKNRYLHKSITGKELVPTDLNDDTSAGEDETGNLEAVKEKFDALVKDEKGGIDEEQLRELLTTISAEEEAFNMDEAVRSIRQNEEVDVTTWEDFSDWYRTSVFFLIAKESGEEEKDPFWAALKYPEDAGVLGIFWHTLQLPILVALVFSTPDVRRPGMGNWCYAAFLISILWIGVFAYFMVGWTEIIGNTIGVPHVVLGYTVLAAGTSVPDLLSSVIVTRQGSGDMAISSSIGSNIFDITVGLPIPWLIYMAFPDRPNTIAIDSGTIWISIFVFLGMLVLVVATIHCQGWKLTKTLGAVMITFYFVFLAQAIILELPFDACV